MDNLDKIIKQKVEQFEVPYNDAHWAEMDGRLNSIRAAKIKNTVLGSAAAVAVIAISSYLFFNYNNTNNAVVVEENNMITENHNTTNPSNNNNEAVETVIGTNDVVEENNVIIIENNTTEVTENNVSNEVIKTVENNNTEVNKQVVDNDDKKISNPMTVEGDNVNTGFIVYNNQVCLGENVSFEALETDQPVSYKWNFGDGTVSYNPNPSHIYKNSGTYTVSLSLINRQKGIEYPSSIEIDAVNILDLPKTDFTYNEVSLKYDDNKLKYPHTILKVKEKNNQNTYKWDLGNGEKSSIAEAKTIYSKAGNYTVSLTVTGANGCESKIEKSINIKTGTELFVESAFTPNNDEKNPVFMIKALKEWDVKFTMTILDKSGRVVYETSDKNEPWNGKLNNTGQQLPLGLYLWKLVTYDVDGVPQRHKGQIRIVD